MIRPAAESDLPHLRAIQRVSLAEPWDGLLEPAVVGPPVVLVVTDHATSEPVGYAVAIPDDDGAYLAEIAVAPDHRGEGNGSRLLEALCDRLAVEGFETVRLTVREGDERARSFYADHGFSVQSRLPEHYEDDDGLVMARDS
ncbi:GNAT family N-acetyltransferase [Halorientalis halophila]|uniref:GNAT family N-acetyltransferase n=1 Tax=Halorientalis halophila TaxID=3108499 RepID=UPI00300B40BD